MFETIYRVQNLEGIGPYRGTDMEGDSDFLQFHNDCEGHPTPDEDHEINRNPLPHEQCGFISLEQLYVWFTHEEVISLEELGFEIEEVVGEITAISEYQCLFVNENVTGDVIAENTP